MDIGAVSSGNNEWMPIANDEIPLKTKQEQTTTNIAYLFFKSPLIWTFGGLTAFLFLIPIPASLLLTTTLICGIVTFPYYIPKTLLYEGAIIDGITKDYLTKIGVLNKPYYNEILPGIYLGALPLKNFNHDKTLIEKLKIKAVLTVIEDYELATETLFSSPVQKNDWTEQGVGVCHISIKDMTSLSIKDLHIAADFIKEHKESIYIHCKAGMGRSVMCLMAYLMKYKYMTYKDAERFVKCKRPATSLQIWQKERLKEFSLENTNCLDILDYYD